MKLPDLAYVLLALFLMVLWFAGGASRADVIGQVVTRVAAWAIAIAAILFIARPRWQPIAPVAVFLAAIVLLVAIQLIPLPPAIWTELPGRELLAQSAIISGQDQPWRPLSISPDATVNALSSLIVPVLALVLMGSQLRESRWKLVTLLLGLIVAANLIGLVQFSGTRWDNPLVNGAAQVSGNFANRNHLALFAACGCILAPIWAYRERQSPKWKGLAAAGLLIFFLLMILATGSRAGIMLGVIGVGIGLLSVGGRIAKQVQTLPRSVWIPVVLIVVGAVIAAIVLSITLGRAVSVERAQALNIADDLRGLALPTVLGMMSAYWPVGTGYGTFDPAYRISEPSNLLSPNYFNHAHNDLIEVILDGGFAGLLILLASFVWVAWRSFHAWRKPIESSGSLLARAGSGLLLLIILASAFDYPARTPMIMALVVIAAVWVNTTQGFKGQAEIRS